MTNILDRDRRAPARRRSRRRRAIPSLARFRALARELGIHLHIGSMAIKLGRTDQRRQPRLPDRAGRRRSSPATTRSTCSTSICRRRELPRIGASTGRATRRWSPTCRGRGSASRSATTCASRSSTGRWPRPARRCSPFRRPSPARPARRTGTCCCGRGRSRPAPSSIAAAQGGHHEDGRDTYGHSMIVDPVGQILAEAGTEPGVIIAEIDPAASAEARAGDPGARQRARLRAAGCSRRPRSGAGGVMIRYTLLCADDHEFEALVPFERRLRQAARPARRRCPICGDTKVEKALMAPSMAGTARRARRAAGHGRARSSSPCPIRASRRMVEAMQRAAQAGRPSNADYVGDRFAEEARKIHYEEVGGARHLRRGDRRGGAGAGRGGHRVPAAAVAARGPELTVRSTRPKRFRPVLSGTARGLPAGGR